MGYLYLLWQWNQTYHKTLDIFTCVLSLEQETIFRVFYSTTVLIHIMISTAVMVSASWPALTVIRSIGQTGGSFKIRFQEHQHSFRNNNCNSEFVQHLLGSGRSFGKTENIKDILYFGKKGAHPNSVERFHIYNETLVDSQLSEKYTVAYSKIFEIVLVRQGWSLWQSLLSGRRRPPLRCRGGTVQTYLT